MNIDTASVITMDSTKISIIVPVYNMSAYLRRCLDSCVYQSLSEIEVIVVNDASPDIDDSRIMREYEKNYPNKVRNLFLTENRCLGGARNAGLEVAQGEYIMFVDSDDYIDFNACEKMYRKADTEQADLVFCDFYMCKDGNLIYCSREEFSEVKGEARNRELIQKSNLYVSSCMSLVRRALVVDNNLSFPEGILFEDLVISPLLIMLAEQIVKIEEALYFYMVRPSSISQTISKRKLFDLVSAIDFLKAKYSETIHGDALISPAFVIVSRHIITYMRAAKRDCPDDYLDWVMAIKKSIGTISDVFSGCKTRKETELSMFLKMLETVPDEADGEECNRCYASFSEAVDYFYATCASDVYNQLMTRGMPRVCVWGAGSNGTAFAKILSMAALNTEYTDVRKELHGKVMPNGAVVKPWDEICDTVDIVIICTSTHFKSVFAKIGADTPIFDWEMYCNTNKSIEDVLRVG